MVYEMLGFNCYLKTHHRLLKGWLRFFEIGLYKLLVAIVQWKHTSLSYGLSANCKMDSAVYSPLFKVMENQALETQ